MEAREEMFKELFTALIINPEILVATHEKEHMDCKWFDDCFGVFLRTKKDYERI